MRVTDYTRPPMLILAGRSRLNGVDNVAARLTDCWSGGYKQEALWRL